MFLRVGPRRALCRYLTSYSPKVRAYPFKLSPSDAILEISQSLTVLGSGDPAALFRSLTRSGPVQPEKIVPVYFPAWFIDAEIEASTAFPGPSGSENGNVTAVFINSYLPGHTMDKLSSVSLLSENLAVSETVPFSAELETQFDTKVTCLPFMTTPFSILDAANSLPASDCRIDEDIQIEPSSIHTNLISAYPVLIPLYLAQYSFEYVSKTVLLEAHSEEGRIFVERVQRPEPNEDSSSVTDDTEQTGPKIPHKVSDVKGNDLADSITRLFLRITTTLEEWLEKAEAQKNPESRYLWYARGRPTTFANISNLVIPPTWTLRKPLHIPDWHRWVDNFFTPDSLRRLVVDDRKMGDPRIRPFTKEEVKQVRIFFMLGQERAKAHTFADHISKVEVTGGQEKTIQEVKAYAESLCDRRVKATPAWWKEWENLPK
ncbi:hypothetical protein GGX14DRAFT_418352 [Mycena pura]|uniref:Uncharacterized protein n=1 Tax=Mycena pura TaxID=153505 RepID=A0AAD6YRD2_9AGAR|nr:hypothetical protein GGX14DRAFT_418352 [Mycena pura]